MPLLDPEERDALRQALGLDRAARPYRNHLPAPGDDPLAGRLVERGFLQRGPATPGGLVIFQVTEAGARQLGTRLPGSDPGR
ncbi:hypothetical protein [Belnapia rosea]|uniref:Uncharacterized protein n=1 Tax=Belnapia rosea TaxID=938405 RepID=A0A1G6LGQ9_9PROT|nr:hypothetical protein [Belnapia rosea]SDB47997.1 hypothetical protein SAMN02927895_01810 [Belnapia rosea]SDC42419.1 hypothetical protein SAMN04487779_1001890 [Belnapia rosea]